MAWQLLVQRKTDIITLPALPMEKYLIVISATFWATAIQKHCVQISS